MEFKQYINPNNKNEVVVDVDRESYFLKQLGLEMKPLGEDGKYNEEQKHFLKEFIDYYFDDWECEIIEDEDILDLEYLLEMEDRRYQDKLEKEWGL